MQKATLKSQRNKLQKFLNIVSFCSWIVLIACQPPLTEEDCRKSLQCEQKGLCLLESQKCVIGTADDCKNSRFCYDLGLCSLDKENGRCAAFTEAECRASTQCKTRRRCIASDGLCVEITPGWCRRRMNDEGNPTLCKTLGACAFDSTNQTCNVRNEKDCVASDACHSDGRCSISSGRCAILSDRDCRQSKVCEEEGRCHAANREIAGKTQDTKTCIATSQKDCDLHCKDRKVGCIFDLTLARCLTGPAFCLDSDLCRINGQCSWEKASASCVTRSDQDCKKSRLCSDTDRCKHYKGECVHQKPDPCEEKRSCYTKGQCSTKSGKCLPSEDKDCQASLTCKEAGNCKLSGNTCKPKANPDCIQSKVCKEKGKCTYNAKATNCMIGSPLDCENSTLCQQENRCFFKECEKIDIDRGIQCKIGEGICAKNN